MQYECHQQFNIMENETCNCPVTNFTPHNIKSLTTLALQCSFTAERQNNIKT